jgi:hypothetical protein
VRGLLAGTLTQSIQSIPIQDLPESNDSALQSNPDEIPKPAGRACLGPAVRNANRYPTFMPSSPYRCPITCRRRVSLPNDTTWST